MTEDNWLILLAVITAVVVTYELFTSNLTRWSERAAVRNITKYCNIVAGNVGTFVTDEFPVRNQPPYDPRIKAELNRRELLGLLSALSPELARAVIELGPVKSYLIEGSGIMIVYKYNRIIFSLIERKEVVE